MAKKQEVKKIRPSDCVRSLEDYNNKVLMFKSVVEIALSSGLIDPVIAPSVAKNLREVNEFYNED